ncbi:MAG: class I SAM-dependent methyltransferase [Candidatus Aminicenantes bacterium]|nr:class I SAM-dependent methyltransferase [Candidatus Aminicenantes bacterium]
MAERKFSSKRYINLTIPRERCRHLPCDLCGVDKTRHITEANGFDLVRCRNCGFVYVDPRPTREALRDFYEEYFVEGEENISAWRREFQSLYREIRERINRSYGKKGKILDVGCSFGFFLDVMKEDGWDIYGLDYSRIAVDYAVDTMGFPHVLRGGIEDGLFADETFDVVTSFYVLEHVLEPTDMLQYVFRVLKKGGLAVNRVPFTRPLIPFFRLLGLPVFEAPMHLNDFSPRTMPLFLEKAGFKDIHITATRSRRAEEKGTRLAMGATAAAGRLVSWLSRGRLFFPLTGAFLSLARKPEKGGK